MKRKIVFLVVIVMLFTIGCLLVKTISLINHGKQVRSALSKLTNMPLVDLDSIKFSIPTPKKNLFIVFFSTTCGNCHYEIKDFKENISRFSNFNIVLVSEESLLVIREFANRYALKYSNLFLTKIRPQDTYDTFGSLSIPHTFIYNKDSILIKEFRGPHTVETMLKTLE